MDLERTGQETIDLSNKSATDTTILKIPKERDSLHKFAISKMLGITDEEEGVPAKAPKLTRTYPEVKKVDENCNNVANSERKSPSTAGSRNSSPHSVTGPSRSREEQTERLGHCHPPSFPHTSYDFSSWPGSLFRGMAPHFSPYLPFGMPIPGFSAAFPPFHSMTSEHQFPLKALGDPFLALNAMRHAFPSRDRCQVHIYHTQYLSPNR